MSEAAFSPGAPEQFWDYGVELRRSFRRIVESLTQADRLRTKQESLAEMRHFYDGHQVNFAAQIVIGTGMRG
jgi:hypothetical protein